MNSVKYDTLEAARKDAVTGDLITSFNNSFRIQPGTTANIDQSQALNYFVEIKD